MPVLIPLTRGASTLVDEIDLPLIERYRWHAGGPDGRFYARRSTKIIRNGVEVKFHRLLHRDLMGMGFGYDVIVDHINGDTLDNRRINLRICSQSENNANRRRPLGGGTSRFRGVFLRKDCMRWSASITHNNSSRGLGVFDNEEDAARAYDAAAIKLHGEFARLNFPTAMIRNHSGMALSMSGQKLTEISK